MEGTKAELVEIIQGIEDPKIINYLAKLVKELINYYS